VKKEGLPELVDKNDMIEGTLRIDRDRIHALLDTPPPRGISL
jgi:hypothetical protein